MFTANLIMLFTAVLDGILDFATGITHRHIEDLTHSLASTMVKKITSITQEVRCVFFFFFFFFFFFLFCFFFFCFFFLFFFVVVVVFFYFSFTSLSRLFQLI